MVTPELKDYVGKLRAKGMPPDQIKSLSVSSGWKIIDVEEVLDTSIDNGTKATTGRKLWQEAATAATLSLPIMLIPLLSGTGIYKSFWWQLIFVALIGAILDNIYCLTLRKLLTPTFHPSRIHMRFLSLLPIIMLIILWLAHLPLTESAAIALLFGLIASIVIGGTLVWDSLISSVGFGLLYLLFYLALRIPAEGPIRLIHSFSGIQIFDRPIEEVALVFLFGAIWGPLSAALRFPPINNIEFQPRHHLAQQIAFSAFALMVAGTCCWIYVSFVSIPTATASNNTRLASLTSPLTVNFNKPINQQQLSVIVSPPIDGQVSFSSPFLQKKLCATAYFYTE